MTFKTIKVLTFTLGCYSISNLEYCGRKFMVLIDYIYNVWKLLTIFPIL